MSQVADSGVATRTFEYAFLVPDQAVIGTWTVSVTAHEGTEGTVSHTANGGFDVRGHIDVGHSWVGANPGDAVSLGISGGLDAVAGSSTAPSSTVNATAASDAGTTITLDQAYTTGVPGDYVATLSCTRDSDSAVVTVSGTALSRTFTMPTDSSVTCAWTNTRSVPLTVVKLSVVHSDPVHDTTNPKAIPGAIVEYQIFVTNASPDQVDADTIFISDALDPNLALQVTDINGAGTGPVLFTPDTSGLGYTFSSLGSTTDDVEFFCTTGGWSCVPSPDGNGVDTDVEAIRINPKGAFNAASAQFELAFRVRIK
jgi:uncharacterized repeat protein (TIGR01451 family)